MNSWIQKIKINIVKKLHFEIGTFLHFDIDIYNEHLSFERYRLPELVYKTEITDALHKAFGFRTNNKFISDKTMKKIFKVVEKG